MEFNHTPVMLNECLEGLNIKPEGIYIDGTVGGGGHSLEILKRLGVKSTLVGIDQDEYALVAAKKTLENIPAQARIILVHSNFSNIRSICLDNKIKEVDGILLDIGVSSHQLDVSERGFSYMKDAPLDMRMNKEQILTARVIINEYDRKELIRVIRDYGEEKWAVRIADFIVRARQQKAVNTTAELVDIIKAAIPSKARKTGPHPAKRTFQAIRIEVNNELGVLKKALEDGISVLGNGGRFCVISFHSLEDRIVKESFVNFVKPCTCPPEFPVCICGKRPQARFITRKPLVAKGEEVERNPRSRSAKLRIIEKI